MGAMDFTHDATGTTAKDAFESAVSDAGHEYGHGGYTGTIAEKHEFKMVPVPEGQTPEQVIEECMNFENDHFCQDKWGAAACVQTGPNSFTFFGCASS